MHPCPILLFLVIPAEELTSRVIVGLGYACTANTCTDTVEQPSPIWVTPVEDATISVDYDSDGIIDAAYNVTRLDQLLVTDAGDQDMSGASIYANSLSDPTVEVDMAVVSNVLQTHLQSCTSGFFVITVLLT